MVRTHRHTYIHRLGQKHSKTRKPQQQRRRQYLSDGVWPRVEEPRSPLIVVRHHVVLDPVPGDAVVCRWIPRHLDRRHRQTAGVHIRWRRYRR